MNIILVLIVAAASLFAQVNVNPPPGPARQVVPVTTLPTFCSVSQVVFKTNESAGQNLYGCTSTNTWTLMGGVPSGGTVTSVSWTGGIVSIANPTTTPAFTIAGTSGGIPYFSGASTWASSAAGVAGAMMAWGGVGASPTSPLSLLVTNQNSATETWTFRNTTASTGVTNIIARGGAGQAGGNVFRVVSNGNSDSFAAADNGLITLGGGSSTPDLAFTGGIRLRDATNQGVLIDDSRWLGFATSLTSGTTPDTALGRSAAGVFCVSNGSTCGTASNLRDILLRQVVTTPVTVSGLQTCNAAAKGTRSFVTDSNAASYTAGIGATVAGGGSTNVPVFCDGTNWLIG